MGCITNLLVSVELQSLSCDAASCRCCLPKSEMPAHPIPQRWWRGSATRAPLTARAPPTLGGQRPGCFRNVPRLRACWPPSRLRCCTAWDSTAAATRTQTAACPALRASPVSGGRPAAGLQARVCCPVQAACAAPVSLGAQPLQPTYLNAHAGNKRTHARPLLATAPSPPPPKLASPLPPTPCAGTAGAGWRLAPPHTCRCRQLCVSCGSTP
jgi:hypothetical protein